MLDNPPTSDQGSFTTPHKKEIYDIPLSIRVAASQPRFVGFDYLE